MDAFTDNWDALHDTNPNTGGPHEVEPRRIKSRFRVAPILKFVLPSFDRMFTLYNLTTNKPSYCSTRIATETGVVLMEVAGSIIPAEYSSSLSHRCFWLRPELDWEIIVNSDGNKFLVPLRKIAPVPSKSIPTTL